MGEQDPLFCFLDNLSNWVQMEFERRGVPELASVIATAECLVELKIDSSKPRGKKTLGDSDRDRDKSRRWHKPTILKDKGRDKKDEISRKYPCFLWNGLIGFLSARSVGNLVGL